MEQFTLRDIRKKKHFTRKELADRSGISECAIKFLEDGTNDPFQAKISTLIKLATALKCRVKDFYPCEKRI